MELLPTGSISRSPLRNSWSIPLLISYTFNLNISRSPLWSSWSISFLISYTFNEEYKQNSPACKKAKKSKACCSETPKKVKKTSKKVEKLKASCSTTPKEAKNLRKKTKKNKEKTKIQAYGGRVGGAHLPGSLFFFGFVVFCCFFSKVFCFFGFRGARGLQFLCFFLRFFAFLGVVEQEAFNFSAFLKNLTQAIPRHTTSFLGEEGNRGRLARFLCLLLLVMFARSK